MRLSHLDGLRFFAFLAVFIHHVFGAPLLWAGVDVFFVLSGFLITGILIRTKEDSKYYKNFYLRRLFRIFPPYYLFIIFVFIFIRFDDIGQIGYFLTYTSNIANSVLKVEVPESLVPMWSLAIEEQFYLIWPFVVRKTNLRGLVWVCVALLALAPLLRAGVAVVWDDHYPAYYLLPMRIDLLAAGGLIALARVLWSPEKFLSVTRWGIAVSAIGAVLFVGLTLLFPSFRTGANSILFNAAGYSLILVVVAGALAWLIPRQDGLVARSLSTPVIVYLGTISYVLYLVHQLIIVELKAMEIADPLIFVVGLLITIGIAAISWVVLEKPMLSLKDRYAAYEKRPAG